MTATMSRIERRRLHAPEQDGGVLVEPPAGCVGEWLVENRALREAWDADVQGRPLGELIGQARRDLVEAAYRYTAEYRDVAAPDADACERPILLAGHQPELFHPGVWMKNFALGRLAECHGATAVNLLIDNDTARGTSLRVPSGSIDRPRFVAVALDRPSTPVPHEERAILDRSVFDRFGDQVAEHIGRFVDEPLIETLWPMAIDRADATGCLGLALAQARHQLEGHWGLATLELPQSAICRTESFRWMIVHLLANLPRLNDVYNDAVNQYRRRHGIRSQAHPVPNLTASGPWLEAPLWVWTRDDPRRRPVMARCENGRITIGDGGQRQWTLPLSPDGDAGDAGDVVARLAALEAEGVKIRSRALITTLWARVAMGDLFIHGIGGAKYDDLTDKLIEQFLGLRPPHFMVVSGTLRLPAGPAPVGDDRVRRLKQQLRRLDFHPEVFIESGEAGRCSEVSGNGQHRGTGFANPDSGATPRPDDGTVAELIAQKRRWIDTVQTAKNARKRCHAIRNVNALLQPCVEPLREQLNSRLDEALRRRRASRVLHGRELSFCLHSRDRLREFLDQTLPFAEPACSNG